MIKLLDGRILAKEIRAEVAVGVAELLQKHQVNPGLAAVLVGNDPASAIYVRNKRRACEEVGMFSETFTLSSMTTQAALVEKLQELNADHRFHGILVQLPLPTLHPYNVGKLTQGRPDYIPGTPAGIQQLLVRNGYDPEGKNVVICGRSNIVGKPLANLLMQRRPGSNATVTMCHTRTENMTEITKQADILIAALGQPLFITADMVKEGAVVIDVGINRVVDTDRRQGYRLVGDVDFESVSEKVEAITPVPGGVGPMTIAMLLVNALTAARLTVDDDEE